MKKLITAASVGLFAILAGCGGNEKSSDEKTSEQPKSMVEQGPPAYDAKRGAGKFTAENVAIGDKIDATMAASGEAIAKVKCFSCHKATDEKLVGPGWKGVTKRKQPEWIMNFITNPDEMIDQDPEVQAQLELCLVRMPNQNLTDDEARSILEFMRQNDETK